MKPSLEQIKLLNSGQMESRNLMDALAVDFNLLCLNSFVNFSPVDFPQKTGFIKKMQITAKALYDQYGFDILPELLNHKSNTIKSFACYVISLMAKVANKIVDLKVKLDELVKSNQMVR